MKTGFVRELTDGQAVTSLFLVHEKEIRTSPRTGKSWLQLSLGDRTGVISAKMWDNFDTLVTTFDRDDVVHIRGRVKTYNGEKELTIEQIVPAQEREYEMGDFLPHTRFDVERMYAELRATVVSVQNPWLQKLLVSVVDDPEIAPRLKRAPAAMSMHHAFIGGLLEHVMSLLGLAKGLCEHYTELDRDLVVTGVILHDIGKIEELRYARGIDYTTEGRLLGHITIGSQMVRRKIDAIPGFPPQLAVLVTHLILSHHGSLEFASPTLPQTREALALHFLDDIDSKMAATRATIEAASSAPGVWTERNGALRRALVRPDQYLAGAPDTKASGKADAKAPATDGKPGEAKIQLTLKTQ
jgi:3'-5' exoribonuclease